jgi:hypothetical protein
MSLTYSTLTPKTNRTMTITRTATVEFITKEDNSQVIVRQNSWIIRTSYPSELASVIQKLLISIDEKKALITELPDNKIEVQYSIEPKQLLTLASSTTVVQDAEYQIAIKVDNRPAFQDSVFMIAVVVENT